MLSRLVDVLVMQASTVAFESSFSAGGWVVDIFEVLKKIL